MAPRSVLLLLLLLVPIYVSAFLAHPRTSVQHRRTSAQPSRGSSSVSMMSTPYELPTGSKEEAVAAFDALVVNQDVPTLVYFHAKWCGPCIMQGPVFDKIAEDYDGRVKVVKLDCDNHQFLMNKYRVRGLPFTALFNEGKVIARHEGFLDLDGQISFLKKIPGFETI